MDGAKNNERDSLSVNTVTNRDTKKILVGKYMGSRTYMGSPQIENRDKTLQIIAIKF